MTRWIHSTQELAWGLLPYRSYLPLTSEWLLAHLTGLWAGGELCNKELHHKSHTHFPEMHSLCAALRAMERSGIQTAS